MTKAKPSMTTTELHKKRQKTLHENQEKLCDLVMKAKGNSPTAELFLKNAKKALKKGVLPAVVFSNLKTLANKVGVTQGKGYRGTHGFNTGYTNAARPKKDSQLTISARAARDIAALEALPKPLTPPNPPGVPNHRTWRSAVKAL